MVRAALPALIANIGVVLIIVYTLSLFSFIFTVHVNYRGRCLEHLGCGVGPHRNVLPITQFNLIEVGARHVG